MTLQQEIVEALRKAGKIDVALARVYGAGDSAEYFANMPRRSCKNTTNSNHSLTRIPSRRIGEQMYRAMTDEILDSLIVILCIAFSMLLFAGFISELISEGSTGSFLKIAWIAIIIVPFSR